MNHKYEHVYEGTMINRQKCRITDKTEYSQGGELGKQSSSSNNCKSNTQSFNLTDVNNKLVLDIMIALIGVV